MRSIAGCGILFALFGSLIFGTVWLGGGNAYTLPASTPTVVQARAPEFVIMVYDLPQLAQRGTTLRRAELTGQIIVLNFWATWCAPCREEMPVLEAIWQDYRTQDMIVLGVNFDEPDARVLTYLTEQGFTYPNGPDQASAAATAYNIMGIPETFVIDQNGRVTRYFLGAVSDATLRAELDHLLENQAN